MEKNSKIKKGIVHVFIANVINLIISLFTGFILPKYLSIETYSNIKLFQLYITYTGIMHLGFSDGMYLRNGGKCLESINKKEVLDEFYTFKIFQLIMTIVAIGAALIIKNEMLFLCALVILPINVSNYIRSLYNSIGLFKKYSRYTNINTLMIFFINVILLLIIKADYYMFYIGAYIVVYFLYWFFIEFENRKIFGKSNTKFNIKYLNENVKNGFFLLIGNFCNVIFTSIDRVFIKYLFGMIKFAFYSFAVSIENLMNVFITPISTVMYNYFCTNTNKHNVIQVKKYILLFSAFIIIMSFPAKFIIDVWLTKYKESLTVLFLLMSAQYIAIMIRCVHVNLYKAEKKQNKYFKIMMIIVMISIVFNIIGYIIWKDMISIAIATLLTNIIWFIIGEIDFKNYRMNICDYLYIFLILILFIICSCIKNSIIAAVLYCIIALVLSIILEKNVFFEIVEQAINIIKEKIFKNKIGEKNV